MEIGSRFSAIFKDDDFKSKHKVDKYGRKVQQSTAEDMKKYYALDKKKKKDEDEGDSDDEEEEVIAPTSEVSRIIYGEGLESSDDSSDFDDSVQEESEEEGEEVPLGTEVRS
mgnify:CR=1 FL=1